MKIQFIHLVMSSMRCWIEHTLLEKGEAFSNSSGFFYDVKDVYNGYYTYSLPYQPIVADASITGATIMTGVYLDGTLITTGQSGLEYINYEKGQLYFSNEISNSSSRLSGNFSIADFNVKITSAPEEELLFETKHELKSKTNQLNVTGLNPNSTTFPIIYIQDFGGRTDPFAFGGTDKEMINVRMIVFADSQFNADAVGSIFKDKTRTIVPLLTTAAEMPFNVFGDYSNGVYNYKALTTGRHTMTDSFWIEHVDVSNLPGSAYSEIRKLNPHVFVKLIDIFLESVRNPRI
jgi:hypothetical protein